MSTSHDPTVKIMTLRKQDKVKDKVKGEAQVWLTGMGLALALVLAAVLLGVIVINGFSVFWPKRVTELTLIEGGKTTLIAGQVMKIQQRAAPEPGPDLRLGAPRHLWQLADVVVAVAAGAAVCVWASWRRAACPGAAAQLPARLVSHRTNARLYWLALSHF